MLSLEELSVSGVSRLWNPSKPLSSTGFSLKPAKDWEYFTTNETGK